MSPTSQRQSWTTWQPQMWPPQSPFSGWEEPLAGNRYVSKLGKPRRSSWRSRHLSIRIIFLTTLDNLLLKARKCDNLPFSDSFLVHKSFTDSMVVGERIRSDEHFVWSNQLLENFPTHHNAMEAGLISDYEVCCSKVWNAPVVPKWHSASAGDRSIISSVSSPSASFSSFSSSLSSHHKGS